MYSLSVFPSIATIPDSSEQNTVQDGSGSMIGPRFKSMCATLAIGWFLLAVIGYHVRKNYKVPGDMYFPVTEPNPVICCFDLECSSRAAQREPRCLSGLYSCASQTFLNRGCEICGMNKIPKMILRLGELSEQNPKDGIATWRTDIPRLCAFRIIGVKISQGNTPFWS